MYNILVVDDDRTCLFVLKARLEKWCYQVTTANHPHEALSMLGNQSFDLVMTDVHMPDMDGIKLQECINQSFRLPVILISSDDRAQVMCMGVKNGAQRFFIKPVMADDLKDIWQFAEWWKTTRINNSSPLSQINGSSQETLTVVGNHIDNENDDDNDNDNDNDTGRRRRRFSWTSSLHNRFVEAILVIGYHRAVPTNILEVMNVEGLTRGQVASHLQKYQRFLELVLAGKRNIELSNWIDLNYYSRFVSGNPNIVLLNLLRDELRKGKLAAHNPLRPPQQGNFSVQARAPNGSFSSFHPLPRLTLEEGSSSGSSYASLMQKFDSSAYAASRGLERATSCKAQNENMGSYIGSSTSNYIHNLSYGTIGHMDYYNQINLAQEYGTCSRNRGLDEGANSYMLSSANNVIPSSFGSFWNNSHFDHTNNVGGKDNNSFFQGNNFNHDQLTQIANKQGVPSMDISSGAIHCGNTSAMNAHILVGQEMNDGSWFNDIERENGDDYSFNFEFDEDEEEDNNEDSLNIEFDEDEEEDDNEDHNPERDL